MGNWFRGRENATDDAERSRRLLQGVEDAYEARTGDPVNGGELTDFETVVLHSTWPAPGQAYPPAGHDYPMRNR
ncbi:hypothetical protein ACIGDI_39750 [Streptomyces sp. NPDC085900]|uniref:hypothetical protein n=1 Tax=Streptomyces sp. NPDC085900 TaxID=3365737 RepID=UPI0037D42578